MQSERIQEPVIDRKEAELAVKDTIIRSEEAKRDRRQMGKARILFFASACGIIYLAWAGVRHLTGQSPGTLLSERTVLSLPWYGDPVVFYIWAGILSVLCMAAAFVILWRSDRISEV